MRIIDNQKICIQLLCILLMMLIISFNIGAKEFSPVAKTGIAGESIVYESVSNTTVINDENTPLSRIDNTWSLYNLITALASCLIGFVMLFRRQDSDNHNYYRYKMFRVMAMVTGFLSIIVFVLTESTTALMVIFDDFSILMTVLLAVNIVILFGGNTVLDNDRDIKSSL